MKRPIAGFHVDEEGHWVARLSCCHKQHVRHQPPFVLRPWTQSLEGREAMLGHRLECPLCDAREFPDGMQVYKKTAEFTERSMPTGLSGQHATRPGIWGVITVVQGTLRYLIEPPYTCEQLVRAGQTAIVVPEMRHRIAPEEEVRFYVEYYRCGGSGMQS